MMTTKHPHPQHPKHATADWDQPPSDESPHVDPLAKVEGAPEGTVRIRCTSHMRPATDKKDHLAYGEEADVPEAIADNLIANGVAERV